MVYERLYVWIPLYTDVFRFKYMFNVSIREYFSVLNVFIVCIRNTTMFKLIPLLCTHIYSYMFSTVHPPSFNPSAGAPSCIITHVYRSHHARNLASCNSITLQRHIHTCFGRLKSTLPKRPPQLQNPVAHSHHLQVDLPASRRSPSSTIKES